MDLETAIKIHLENEHKWIRPDNNSIINQNAELHIMTIEKAPRDSKALENRIAKKKQEMEETKEAIKIDRISAELQALERLCHIVQRHEAGLPLDGLDY